MVYYQYITAADLPRSIPFFVTSEGVVFNQWGLNPAPPLANQTLDFTMMLGRMNPKR